MPATWSKRDDRMYGHIVASCRQRGRHSPKRCKRIAAATVNKARRREGRTLNGLGTKLPGYKRRAFCLPGRTPSAGRYPVPDCSHARNARARATAAYNEGYLTRAEHRRVMTCAARAMKRHCQ